jgi:hypothetical protein
MKFRVGNPLVSSLTSESQGFIGSYNLLFSKCDDARVDASVRMHLILSIINQRCILIRKLLEKQSRPRYSLATATCIPPVTAVAGLREYSHLRIRTCLVSSGVSVCLTLTVLRHRTRPL